MKQTLPRKEKEDYERQHMSNAAEKEAARLSARRRVGARTNITSKRVGRRIPARLALGRGATPGAPEAAGGPGRGSRRGDASESTYLNRQAGLNLGGQRYAGRLLLLPVLLLGEHRGPGPVRGKAQSADGLRVPDLHHVLVHRGLRQLGAGRQARPGRRR